ncbi:hypothetical protein OROHE_007878 [Orobanche hederae]
MSFEDIIIIIFSFTSLFTTIHLPAPMSALPINPDQVQTQTLHPNQPATIPAFPEQSQTSACPLDLPDNLFRGIKSACVSQTHQNRHDPDFYSDQLHHSRCCPVLAAWLYSAYSKTGLRATTAKTPPQSASYDMPVLPGDSETCVDTLEKALSNRGVKLHNPNDTCDVVYCYCGIRLHPFSCPESFHVNTRGKLVGGESVKKLERDCFHGGSGGGLRGCSKCLNSLYLLNGVKAGRSNRTERTHMMHDGDCQLMGLTWLLNKNRSAYIHTVSAVLRAMMMSNGNASDPASCSLDSDGMPFAVDSSEINNRSSLAIRLYQGLLPLSLLCMSILFLFTRY